MGTTAPAVATAAGGEQSALNLLLVLAQPGEILVQIVFVEAAPDAEHIAGGMHLGQADGRETRTLVQEAGNFGGGPDGADGSAFLQLNAVEGGEGGQVALVLEGEFDGGDLGGIAVGEVGIFYLKTSG